MNPLGKLSPAALERLVLRHLGKDRKDVLVGPRAGTDAGLVSIGGGRVMAMTTDPLSLVPALGPEKSARLACHLVASDLWTTGIAPSHASVTLSFPPHLSDDTIAAYCRAMGETWAAMDVAVVTGHTGRYEGCDLSIVGAATLVGFGEEADTVGREFVRSGDRVIVSKGCAIETAAIAAHLFPKRLGRALGAEGVRRLQASLSRVSVVADCRAALRAGVRDQGVAMLHDATEGGVLGGLVETALACGHDLRVERGLIPLDGDVRVACEALGVDPYWSLSEGTLIALVRPKRAATVMAELEREGIDAADTGAVEPGAGLLQLVEPDGRVTTIAEPEPDLYWAAYGRAVAEKWE